MDVLGRNIWFGIREHAMGAILNGIAYDGIFRASGATFLVFADYCRPSIRLAALSHLPVLYIFTHDSVGVGEDGPTHQPVETVSGLRVIPNLDVIRPADAEETAAAFVAALDRQDGPTLLALSRQDLPFLDVADVETRRQGVFKGGYVLVKETAQLETILLATGSEVQHAVAAARELGGGVRVVSMPCFERFERQDDAYKEEVFAVERDAPRFDRGGRDRFVVEIRRQRRHSPGHQPLRPERARRHGDGRAGHDQQPRRRSGWRTEISSANQKRPRRDNSARALLVAGNAPDWRSVFMAEAKSCWTSDRHELCALADAGAADIHFIQ